MVSGSSAPGWQRGASELTMSEAEDKRETMRPEYDFAGGERGKYASRYAEGTNVVVLDPDVAECFKTAEDVNDALREVAAKRSASS